MARYTIPIFVFLSLALLFLPGYAQAQGANLGAPPVLNFSRQDFRAGTQMWDIAQSNNGVVWFANNDGLLEFDGTHWRLYKIANGTIVRSARAGSSGKIFVGGQGDFGFFSPDKSGKLEYHSLTDKLDPRHKNFTDVWDIEVIGESVFFRTDDQIFEWTNNQLTPLISDNKTLLFMGKWNSKLLFQDAGYTLFTLENGILSQIGSESEIGGQISASLTLNTGQLLITTIKNGIFSVDSGNIQQWNTSNDVFLKDNRIFCATLLPDNSLALGTSFNGLVTLDNQRRIFHHINKKNGLGNNTVLSLFATSAGSIWLGLDNGTAFADLNSAFSSIFPDGELQGTGYTAEIFDDNIYFGTNTGLFDTKWKKYYQPEEKMAFKRVNGADGQVWNLNLMDDQLLMGHHEGAFNIEGMNAAKLASQRGIWRFISLSPEKALAGHYNGVAIFRKSGNKWVFDKSLSGFSESSRMLAKDPDGVIWMAHPYRGIYRLTINTAQDSCTAERFGQQQGLPSDLGNHLFKLGEKVVFTGTRGVFEFDKNQQKFVPNEKFSQIFGSETRVKYLNQDKYGNIWYVTDTETGVLLVQSDALEKKIQRVPIPELHQKLTEGFQFILPVDPGNVFVATSQGFIHFNPEKYWPKDTVLRIVLHEVRLKVPSDSILFGGYGSEMDKVELSSLHNTLSFSFSAPDFPGGDFIQYAFYLEGIEKTWSDWANKPDATFSHLRPGNYTFHLKARNQYGIESAPVSFSFTILPPWYASRLAYAFYGLMMLGVMISIVYRQQRKFEEEKLNLENQHRLESEQNELRVRRSEEAVLQLQHEKLEAEVHHKSQELASVTMHLVQKNSILINIQEALSRLKNRANTPELDKEIGRIIRMMEHDSRVDDDWEHFSRNFDRVHSDFLKRLAEKHDHLSPNDYRLCAYLRMNLSTKEIASLMNISVRGVEASRYRLRKRLNLETDTNLTDYLMRF
ncbi:MAG: hypothetical protein RJA20_1216 [Bacteroidota bacterium]